MSEQALSDNYDYDRPRETNDPHLMIRFFSKPVLQVGETEKQGRPIYKDVEYVAIRWSGDKHRELEAPAHDKHRMRRVAIGEIGGWETYAESYPVQYAAFKAGKSGDVFGTPLTELPSLTEARRAELRGINIVTVEALASLEGPTMKKLGMDGPQLRDMAKAYLDRAAGLASDMKHAAEMKEMRSELEELRALLAGKGKEGAESAGKSKGGRKKADAEESAEDAQARAAFDAMEDGDIRNYLKDAGGDMSGKTHAALVNAAVKRNAEIRVQRATAA